MGNPGSNLMPGLTNIEHLIPPLPLLKEGFFRYKKRIKSPQEKRLSFKNRK
jgi:hypothetical protein